MGSLVWQYKLTSLLAVSNCFPLSIKGLHAFPCWQQHLSSHLMPHSLSLSQSCTLFWFSLLCAFVSTCFFSSFFLFICGSFYLSFSLIIYFHLRFSFLTSCFLSVWHSCWLPNYLAFHKYTHQHTNTHILSLSHPHTKQRKTAKASYCLQSITKAVCLTQSFYFWKKKKLYVFACVCAAHMFSSFQLSNTINRL